MGLNAAIAAICDRDDLAVRHGKAVPYIGWFWRNVDFDRRITLGDCGDFVGFMENNKWDYAEFTLTEEQDAELKEALARLVEAPTHDACRALWDRVQTYRPAGLPRVPPHPSLAEQWLGFRTPGGAS